MNLVRINDPKCELFIKTMKIYKDSFPVEETRRYNDHINALKDEAFHHDAIMVNEKLVGFMTYWEVNDSVYLEHFAIDEILRGKSYGTKALNMLKEKWGKIILEIEKPVDLITNRRKAFYENECFILNDHNHEPLAYRYGNPQGLLLIMSYPKILSIDEYNSFKEFQDNRIMIYIEE